MAVKFKMNTDYQYQVAYASESSIRGEQEPLEYTEVFSWGSDKEG